MKKLIIKGMDKRYFSEKLVKWYEINKRNLPWRQTKSPYRIWLSEIILQQTRVAQGLPYYLDFIQKYPTVADLAAASEEEVLRTWQGLGYYTRARNLHKCAKAVVNDFNGKFPGQFEQLLQLPGIGEYTAAAIASFSSGEVVPVVDGNVHRVLSRLFGIETPVNSNEAKKVFRDLAGELISPVHPDVHNQAIMEFGALNCIPQNPPCTQCIFSQSCVAFNNNLVHLLPVKTKGREPRRRYFNYLVIEKKGKLSLRLRSDKDIWNGLYDFHLVETKKPASAKTLVESQGVSIADVEVSKTYKHVLTHQIIYSKFIVIRKQAESLLPKNSKFYTLDQVNQLPKPVLISRFLADYYLS